MREDEEECHNTRESGIKNPISSALMVLIEESQRK